MSSIIQAPPFEGEARVNRVLRGHGFVVDQGEAIVELSLGKYHTLTVCSHTDGAIIEMHAWPGRMVRAGDLIATLSGGPVARFEGGVFIAYRRADSSGYTGRIYDGMVRDLGRAQVFRDIGSLKPGRSLVEQVAKALRRSRVMVVVIAPGWLTATDHLGRHRLDDPTDLHRIEIRTAIESGRAIVPTLVGDATMPRRDQLPDDIQQLVQPLAFQISDNHWDADAQGLSDTVSELLRDSLSGDQTGYYSGN
jgi:hypothetical protein